MSICTWGDDFISTKFSGLFWAPGDENLVKIKITTKINLLTGKNRMLRTYI